MRANLALADARKLLHQSPETASNVAFLNRLVSGLHASNRADFVRETRSQIECLLARLEAVQVRTQEIDTLTARARQFLQVRPVNEARPHPKYVHQLSLFMEKLAAIRLPAAVYACVAERADVQETNEQLRRAVDEQAGTVWWYHRDRALWDVPLWERPGWRHVQHLVLDRQIALLAIGSYDDLVPPAWADEPQWGRHGLETWFGSWGVRVICCAAAGRGASADPINDFTRGQPRPREAHGPPAS
ncbi:hypothetical protein ACFYOD_37360 [Streptomyces sp. NPDC006703]|uniref:hypothetical protein n=1 Tax=Streptomyces sp. NPDC006703 TaxID=3364759 RepID=UPI0036B36D01